MYYLFHSEKWIIYDWLFIQQSGKRGFSDCGYQRCYTHVPRNSSDTIDHFDCTQVDMNIHVSTTIRIIYFICPANLNATLAHIPAKVRMRRCRDTLALANRYSGQTVIYSASSTTHLSCAHSAGPVSAQRGHTTKYLVRFSFLFVIFFDIGKIAFFFPIFSLTQEGERFVCVRSFILHPCPLCDITANLAS